MQPIRVPVEEYTSPDPITANENMTVDELQQLMELHGIRHLPILRGEAVVGLISDRDVRLASNLSAAEKFQVQARDIMATDLLSVPASTPLDEVALAMAEKKVGSAIVKDHEGRLYGIFTATDALNALIEIVRTGGAPAA